MKITIRTSATASPADPDDGLRTCGAGRRGRGRPPAACATAGSAPTTWAWTPGPPGPRRYRGGPVPAYPGRILRTALHSHLGLHQPSHRLAVHTGGLRDMGTGSVTGGGLLFPRSAAERITEWLRWLGVLRTVRVHHTSSLSGFRAWPPDTASRDAIARRHCACRIERRVYIRRRAAPDRLATHPSGASTDHAARSAHRTGSVLRLRRGSGLLPSSALLRGPLGPFLGQQLGGPFGGQVSTLSALRSEALSPRR